MYLACYIVIFILTIYPKTSGRTMRQNFNNFNRPRFHTFSSSPTVGPRFLNVEPHLTVTLSNLPVIPSPDTVYTPEPIIVTEKNAAILHKTNKRDEDFDQRVELEIEIDEEIEDEKDFEETAQYECNSDCDLEDVSSIVYEDGKNENIND